MFKETPGSFVIGLDVFPAALAPDLDTEALIVDAARRSFRDMAEKHGGMDGLRAEAERRRAEAEAE